LNLQQLFITTGWDIPEMSKARQLRSWKILASMLDIPPHMISLLETWKFTEGMFKACRWLRQICMNCGEVILLTNEEFVDILAVRFLRLWRHLAPEE
jgi:hypothetical protein